MKLAFRRAIIGSIKDEHGPGPWLLHPDGRVERYGDPESPKDESPLPE